MRRTFATLTLTLALPAVAAAQGAKAAPMDKDAKIANAIAAAPASIAAGATVMDWPEAEGAKPTVLRQGNNGWTCYPDLPVSDGNDPMCIDAPWVAFIDAYVGKTKPKVSRLGIGYMLAPGGVSGSATDPYAEQATPDNDWGHDGPHIMLIVPDAKALEGLPTKRTDAPYVMWAGTPYAHIMVPIGKH